MSIHACRCAEIHAPIRLVLTGGPGAGKTATLEMIRQTFCTHVRVLPEAAGILFTGGFPRVSAGEALKAAQRAIFYVQRELESAVQDNPAIQICDRGTVDGLAYWPGPEDFWSTLATTREAQFARYQLVIHLRTPAAGAGYNRSNPLRIESAAEALAIDERIFQAWDGHPHRVVVPNATDFLTKATRVIDLISGVLPACCAGPRDLPRS